MKLIGKFLKFLGFKSKSGRPRIPNSKQLAIKSAPSNMTDSQLARILKLSYTTIQRYRHHDGKPYGNPHGKPHPNRQRTP